MTADQLRELASTLDQCSPYRDSASVYQAADYLRACADAMEAGPVAWMDPLWPTGDLWPHDSFTSMPVDGWVSVYPVAMPAPAIPQGWRELMVEARDNCKASIAETDISEHRREYRKELLVRLNNMLAAAPTPPVSEKAPYSDIVSDGGMDPRNALDEYRHASDHCLGAAEQDKADREVLGKLCRPLRLPEPMTDLEMIGVVGNFLGNDVYDACRMIEAEVIKRVREANNG